jgi:hypothetical protein
MTSRSIVKRVGALVGVLLAGACGSGMLDVGYPTGVSGGGGGSAGTAATYLGVLGDSLKHGTLTVTVLSSLTVRGVLTFAGGPTVPVAGTVDTAAAQIHATGGGYTIAGFTNLGTISGSYSGPGGNGFLVAVSDSLTGMTHSTYCGSYTSTNSNGFIAMQVLSRGDAGGFVVQRTGTAASSFFVGTVIGSFNFNATTDVGIALAGSLSPDLSTISGTYAPPPANGAGAGTATGQFTATLGGC